MKTSILTPLLALGTLLFAMASGLQTGWPTDYWAWRNQLVLLSGVLLISVMAAAVVLATRSSWLEQRLGGLDQMYRHHRQLGIASAALLAAHWLLKLSPPLALALGALPPQRHGGGHHGFSLIGLAHEVGSWVGYAVLVMLVLSLLRWVPYRFWRKWHLLFAPLYLLGSFHGALLLPGSLWLTPLGAWLALCLLAGAVAALWALAGRSGRARRYQGTLTACRTLEGGLLEVRCQMGPDWPGHRAGQFARVTFDTAEGAHPFSIANGENRQGQLCFVIKALGDYTRTLADTLRIGQAVSIEGPYGRFQPARLARRQVWIAGGIGITPFLSWLETLSGQEKSLAQVDFYYCVPSAEQAVHLPRLRQQCATAGARLHLIAGDQGQRLHADMLPQAEEVWFCGPHTMGGALAQQLATRGPRRPRFHCEAFHMR